MLVFDRFEGDDPALAWRQHAVYAAALAAILHVAERHYRNACAIAGVAAARWPDDPAAERLRDAHDVLAAAWRWEAAPPQPRFAFVSAPRAVDAGDWLHWLAAELARWHDDPELLLATLAVLHDGDAEATERLSAALRDRYASVPWHEG